MSEEDKERIPGTVKWFSNKKGYGFITPTPATTADGSDPMPEDIFVHQSTIHSEGYRTLDEGWLVEFSIGHDDDGKPKAESVTAPGGGPCTGPKRPRHRRKKGAGAVAGEEPGLSAAGVPAPEPQPIWHHELSEQVKEALREKNISTATGTIDISVGPARIKLGTRSYASLAHADAILAEGSFECDPDGNAIFHWQRALRFGDSCWNVFIDFSSLLSEVNLSDEVVLAVGLEETMDTLMGENLPDPRTTLEASGFEMRRVVLTTKKRGV
mmetsp:Transcript_6487/g.9490  ORF Transcript_6487/g.9490 Transcript_6487/m.9490 type:complete len:269 (+) Transcript_6487:202-1008(+)